MIKIFPYFGQPALKYSDEEKDLALLAKLEDGGYIACLYWGRRLDERFETLSEAYGAIRNYLKGYSSGESGLLLDRCILMVSGPYPTYVLQTNDDRFEIVDSFLHVRRIAKSKDDAIAYAIARALVGDDREFTIKERPDVGQKINVRAVDYVRCFKF